MSANQPPFPPYPNQRGQAAPPGPQQGNSQFFPPQLRKGQGQTNNQYNQDPQVQQGQPAPEQAFYNDATQAFQPSQNFSPGGFSQLRSATQFQAGAPQPNQFSPAGNWNNGVNTDAQAPAGPPPWTQQSSSGPMQGSGQFGAFGGASGSAPNMLAAPQGPFGVGTPQNQFGVVTRQLGNTGNLPGANPTGRHPTGQLPGAYSGDTGMLTLNQSVKVVRIPVAGKPGEFKTGILPVMNQPGTGALPPPMQPQSAPTKGRGKMFLLLALVLVVVLGSASYFLLHSGGSGGPTTANQGNSNNANAVAANATATAQAQIQATETAQKSIIASDTLNPPSHQWANVTDAKANIKYFFKDGAYHIRQEGSYLGYALMPGVLLPKDYTYTLTMRNVAYNKDDQNGLSFYCMILNYHDYGNNKAQFYVLRVNNGTNISYEFDKYDNRNIGANDSPWTQIFPDPNNSAGTGKGNGKEFRGPSQPNVYSVSEKNGNFIFTVNGVKIGTAKDTSLTEGALGMGVNQTGTEAAFSNLIISSN